MAGSGPGGAEGGLAVPPHPTQEVPKPYTPAAAARHLGILDAHSATSMLTQGHVSQLIVFMFHGRIA